MVSVYFQHQRNKQPTNVIGHLRVHFNNRQLYHTLQQFVDLGLAIAVIAAFYVMGCLLTPSASRSVQLERPQKVRRLPEVGSDAGYFVNQIRYADDVAFTQFLLDDLVVDNRNSLTLHLCETTFENQGVDGLHVRMTPSDVRFHDTQHIDRGLVQFDENAVVDLSQTEQLQNFTHTRMKTVDTSNANNERQFGLIGNVEIALLPRHSLDTKQVALLTTKSFDVAFCAAKDLSSTLAIFLANQ